MSEKAIDRQLGIRRALFRTGHDPLGLPISFNAEDGIYVDLGASLTTSAMWYWDNSAAGAMQTLICSPVVRGFMAGPLHISAPEREGVQRNLECLTAHRADNNEWVQGITAKTHLLVLEHIYAVGI